MLNSFKLLPLSAVISLIVTSSPILAQDSTTIKSAEKGSLETITVTGSFTVNEVVDTATGLGLTLRETPQSVTVITKQQIQDQALDTIIDTVNSAVGVSSEAFDNVRNNLSSRGFEISNYQIDEVPIAWSLAANSGETISDVSIYERVEFVRGATGLLTGVGDPSASINLVRKHATSTELTGNVSAAIGSWDNREIKADIATGLNDSGSVRGRVVAKYEESDSHMDLYQDETKVLYGVIEADLTENTLIRFGGSYQKNTPTSPTWGNLPGFYTDGTKTDWEISKTTATDWSEWDTENTNLFVNLNHVLSNGWELVANYNKIKYMKESKLVYLWGTVDKETGEGLGSSLYKSKGDSDQDSIDFQLKGDYSFFSQQHEFVLGALYSNQSTVSTSYETLGDIADVGNFFEWDGSFAEPTWGDEEIVDVDMDTEQKGLYGATRLSMSDSFKVIVGGRIASWERKGSNYSVDTEFGDTGVFIPYTGALYDLTQNHRVYISYTEIFKPQSAQDRNGDFLAPIEGKSYEAGLKSSFLDDMFHTNLALYTIEQDNVAQADPGYIIPGTINSQAQRAAEGATSRGFEFEVVGQPVDGWNINAGYSQFEAEDADDVKVNTQMPRKQFKLFTTYRLISLHPDLTIGGGINWQSKTYGQSVEQGAYALVNFMARYDINSNMQVQLNVNNLLDEEYYSRVASRDQYRYGVPKNYNLSFNYSF
ncbi:TonB-dependent siderophore receptor [Pseudoalteromonas haloplanktis]|uniref:TonB-dependent siderophore receptor n=1 Tax=Pseudoalteromonas haloplanktis TaxID=228 RepID=A0ABU1BJT5_PSEHA|nr:TonB-dependent siderophore receptor [Pseudoalteromonas haloplanktis]MDQ9094164.1 TonB-dependent siderophore receptor [Pseudoalteromonas haloplanktis]